jgi:hypothetical protein
MADNQVRRTGANPAAKADGKAGFTVDPGPYEAIVVGHVQGTRMGQLQVFIPDWGGKQTDPSNQIVVSYASPFYGTTYGTDSQSATPGAFTSGQSYGMWCVPPDVGNKVLVTFAAGDRSRGYWFACIYDSPSHHMVPGNSRNIGGQSNTQIDPTQSGPLAASATSDSYLPVSEYSTGQPTAFTADGLVNTPRFAQPSQSMRLIIQGLDRDKVRGAISSSSMREAPSNVYGISTPGRSATGNKPQVPGAYDVNGSQTVVGRLGGHSFVMDDGDSDGNDQLIRLRTAGGHQILMNDVADKTDNGGKGVLYIASASGNQWMEFSSDGSINMFGIAGFNVRTEGALNLHSDSAVNINSGGSVNIHGEMGVKIDSLVGVNISAAMSVNLTTDGFLKLSAVGSATMSAGGAVNLSAIGPCKVSGAEILLNSPYLPIPPIPVVPNPGISLPDVLFGGTSWIYSPGATHSICTVVPCHEPWIDPSTGLRPAPATADNGVAVAGAALSIGAGVASKLF